MTGRYIRYTYWVTPAKREELVAHLQQEGVRVRPARSVMCTPLDEITQASYITPSVWNRICSRQGAWYRRSSRYGQELLVLEAPMESLASCLNTVFWVSDFVPERRATREEMKRLVQSKVYERRRPEEWERVVPAEQQKWERWMAKKGLRASFEEIFLAHRANHANFLDPLIYVTDDGLKIPYSIAPSTHLCSCCLELYNLIGERFTRKFVAPCLGALFFAGLSQDQYFEVITCGHPPRGV